MILVYSCGIGHGPAPKAVEVVFPLENRFRDPHLDPALRNLTGEDPRVVANVMSQPGAEAYLKMAVDVVLLLGIRRNRALEVAFTCVGGRHRSVAFADALKVAVDQHPRAWNLAPVTVIHRDVAKPIIERAERPMRSDFPPEPPTIFPGFP